MDEWDGPGAVADVTVASANVTDVDDIAAIHVASFRATYAGLLGATALERLEPAARAAAWGRRIRARDGEVMVASVAEGAVGFCWFAAVPSADGHPVGEVRSIHVAPGATGRGYGRALLRTAVEMLRTYGCREATLWVVASNHRAQAVYRRDGWRPDGAVRREPLGLPGEEAPEVDVVRYRRDLDLAANDPVEA